MSKLAIGIDIGGTKISMVLGTSSGKILARRVISTQTGAQTRSCLNELIQNIKLLLNGSSRVKKQILGMGVGLPGPVDSKKGIVPRSPHLGGWEGIPLRKLLLKALGLPVMLANDANAAVIGEKVFGQGRGAKNFIYMTISTGIGGGLVVNGQLVEGTSYVGGEVGHMTIVASGDPCKCGKKGCLEAYASGTAIARFVENEIQRGQSSKIPSFAGKGNKVAAREVGLAAKAGDRLALEAYCRAGFYLGIGIANLLNILNPEIIILGGGVLKSAPRLFWQSMLQSCQRDAWPQAWRAVQVRRTKLGDRVGDLGALALVFEKHALSP